MQRCHRFKPLGTPKPVAVRSNEQGDPVHVRLPRKPDRSVTFIRERWRIDDEWWRRTISRDYLIVILDDEKVLTLYHDLLTDEWYVQ
jgi:hypothetical protein